MDFNSVPEAPKPKDKKKKILTISDNPLGISGVGLQARLFIEGMLKTGKYQFISLGGAIKHRDYKPIRTEMWKEDWTVYPVDDYGNIDIIRTMMAMEKPDALWFISDPRFFIWLWQVAPEIRACLPMIYYTVWDNYPIPTFNYDLYHSNDIIVSQSEITKNILENVAPDVRRYHIPLATDTETFKKYDDEEEIGRLREMITGGKKDKFIFFWNNRNARRKQTGTLVWWFKEFLDRVGHDKACLLLHTDPFDQFGQNIEAILDMLSLKDGQVRISPEKHPPRQLAMIYNACDCVLNISDAEGVGLATIESLACEKPIIVNMTGGLQEQVTDGTNWFGIGLEPKAKALVGSQDIPFIYEDRLVMEDFIQALEKMINIPKEEREKMGAAGRCHIENKFSLKLFEERWEKTLDEILNDFGSWDQRKMYKRWTLEEI